VYATESRILLHGSYDTTHISVIACAVSAPLNSALRAFSKYLQNLRGGGDLGDSILTLPWPNKQGT
jgi:hypothetical protein